MVSIAALAAIEVFLFLRRRLAVGRIGQLLLAGPGLLGVAALVVRASAATDDLDLRWTAVFATYAAAVTVLYPSTRRAPTGALLVLAAGGVAAGIHGSAAFVANPPMRLIAARYAPAAGGVSRALGRSTDWDRDGYSTLSGESDCAPDDPDVHPFAREVAGNGIDEDCHGGDLSTSSLLRLPSTEPAQPRPLAGRPNIILILVDTLRADRLGIYQYAQDTSPRLDAFFKDAVVVDRAYASSPVTDRSLPTMFAGQFPSMFFEAVDYLHHDLDPRRVTLFERLAAAGYQTSAISTTYIPKRDNVTQGVEHFDTRGVHDPRAELLTTRALEYLDTDKPHGPLFLWLHYYDPHGPYDPPAEHRLWDDGGAATAANRSARYDAEVHYVDHEIGRLLDGLEDRGVLANALVILAADHGEEFLDHGGYYHATQLYDEQVRVPLIFKMPGLDARRVAGPIGLVDFMPTVLDLVDIPVPPDIAGRSQVSALRGQGADLHPIFLEQFKHKTGIVEKIGVVDGDHKLILDLRNQTWELYDLAADPDERDNLYLRDTAVAQRLRTALLDYWSLTGASELAGPGLAIE